MHFDNFTDILGYHKSFQIVDYTMTNIQKIGQSEIVSSLPTSNLSNPVKIIADLIWQSKNQTNLKLEPLTPSYIHSRGSLAGAQLVRAKTGPPDNMTRRFPPGAVNDLSPTAMLCIQCVILCHEMLQKI
jgi:hypothetical protein